jgi:hypothetical protein
MAIQRLARTRAPDDILQFTGILRDRENNVLKGSHKKYISSVETMDMKQRMAF